MFFNITLIKNHRSEAEDAIIHTRFTYQTSWIDEDHIDLIQEYAATHNMMTTETIKKLIEGSTN